jgi:tetratricopeptide (TPR) repeat protein
LRSGSSGKAILPTLAVFLLSSAAVSSAFSLVPVAKEDDGALYQQGMQLLREKSYLQALEKFKQLERDAPGLPQGYTGEGIALALMGQPDQAIPVLSKAIQLDPSYWVAVRELGIIEWQVGRHDDATKNLKAVIKLFPDDSTVNAILGESSFNEGEYPESLDFFAKAGAQVATSLRLSLVYSEALIRCGRLREAADELAGLSIAAGLDSGQKFRIAWLLGEARAYPRAIEMFNSLPPDFPDTYGRGYGIALAYYKNGQYADCIQQLTDLQHRGMSRATLLSLLGEAEEANGRSAEASEALQNGMAQFPLENTNYIASAAMALRAEQYAAAVQTLTLGIQKMPQDYKLRLLRGVAYSSQGDLHLAGIDYNDSVSLAPGRPDPYLAVAVWYLGQKQDSAAAGILRQALQKGLKDANIYSFLADALLSEGLTPSSPQYQEAMVSVTAGIRINANSAYSYFQRGRLQRVAGRPHEALADFERAEKLDPQSADIMRRFGAASNSPGEWEGELRRRTLAEILRSISDAGYFEE